jgi:DNA-binding LacI/PurR family transcriptional regulator
MQAARARGLAVPDDLSLTGFDDLPMAARADPPLTTLRQPIREAGRTVAGMLLRQVRGRRPERSAEIWTPELIVRQSVGPGPFAGPTADGPERQSARHTRRKR